MRRVVVLFAGVIPLLLFGLSVPVLAAVTDTWGGYQHDTSHSGRTSNIAPTQPGILWVISLGTSGKPSSPIVVDEDSNLYVGVDVTPLKESSSTTSTNSSKRDASGHSGLFTFSPDKKVRWVSKLTGKVTSSPAVGKDAVYAVIGTTLAALNKTNGFVKWQVPLNGESLGGITLGKDGTLYVGTVKGKTLYAVSSDGKIKWQYTAEGQIDSAPALGNDNSVYFTAQDQCLYTLNPNGSFKWKYKVSGISGSIQLSSPVLAPDGTVYFGMTRDAGLLTEQDDNLRSAGNKLEKGRLYAFKPNGGLKWFYEAKGKSVNMPALQQDGNIIISTTSLNYTDDRQYWQGNCYLEAVLPTGAQKWMYDSPDNSHEGPTVIDGAGNIFESSTDGYLTCTTKGGAMVWRAKVGGKVSIGPKGILYVAAKSSIGAVSQRDLNKEVKQSEQIGDESNGGSSYGTSLLIYIIPIAIAAGIGYFFKTRISASTDADEKENSEE
ncbi:MAG: outer membrane protein assembly factor BamB family protein [Candidatus Aquicultor sp.]